MSLPNATNDVEVEITVSIGTAVMPIHQLLRMGRGAVIELDAWVHCRVWIHANDHLIGRGEIVVRGDKVAVEVTDIMIGPR